MRAVAVGAEVRVDRTFLQHARRRGVAVDGVAERFGIGVFEEQLVMQHFAVGGVDDVEVLLLAVFRGGGKPKLAVADDRRGMPFAFERNFPGDVFLRGLRPKASGRPAASASATCPSAVGPLFSGQGKSTACASAIGEIAEIKKATTSGASAAIRSDITKARREGGGGGSEASLQPTEARR